MRKVAGPVGHAALGLFVLGLTLMVQGEEVQRGFKGKPEPPPEPWGAAAQKPNGYSSRGIDYVPFSAFPTPKPPPMKPNPNLRFPTKENYRDLENYPYDQEYGPYQPYYGYEQQYPYQGYGDNQYPHHPYYGYPPPYGRGVPNEYQNYRNYYRYYNYPYYGYEYHPHHSYPYNGYPHQRHYNYPYYGYQHQYQQPPYGYVVHGSP